MTSEPVIYSPAAPSAAIVGSRLRVAAAPTLPERSLGAGQFTVETAECGLTQLVDARGQACGLFVNEQLARTTASCLSR
jgi:hypothetical protein